MYTNIYIYIYISVYLPSIAQRVGGISEVLRLYTDRLMEIDIECKKLRMYMYMYIYI